MMSLPTGWRVIEGGNFEVDAMRSSKEEDRPPLELLTDPEARLRRWFDRGPMLRLHLEGVAQKMGVLSSDATGAVWDFLTRIFNSAEGNALVFQQIVALFPEYLERYWPVEEGTPPVEIDVIEWEQRHLRENLVDRLERMGIGLESAESLVDEALESDFDLSEKEWRRRIDRAGRRYLRKRKERIRKLGPPRTSHRKEMPNDPVDQVLHDVANWVVEKYGVTVGEADDRVVEALIGLQEEMGTNTVAIEELIERITTEFMVQESGDAALEEGDER